MIRQTVRRARKYHLCSACDDYIHPGHLYLFSVCSPNHGDLGNIDWMDLAECRECAERYGRGGAFGPVVTVPARAEAVAA